MPKETVAPPKRRSRRWGRDSMPQVRSILLLRVSSSVDKDVDHPQFFDPPYALKYLQAALSREPDLRVRLWDCWIRPMSASQLLDYARQFGPDLVVVSASSFDVHVADEFVRALKAQENPPWVIGIGQGYYFQGPFRQGSTHRYDAILLGEPEEEFHRLLEAIRSDGVSGGQWKRHYQNLYAEGKRFLVEDPDRLSFPSYTPEELSAYRSIYPVRLSRRVVWGFLIATRGCPHRCAFCSEVMRVSTGARLRSRSPRNVADEMEHLARQGVNICSFQDDSFSAHHGFVRGLCEELIARGSTMPWMARVRVDELDYDLLALMKKAGCALLGIGVESANDRVLNIMQKQKNQRPWIPLCRQIFQWTRQLDISTNAYYVIGNPGETREEIEQTIRLAMELDSDSIQVHFYTPYPGSAAWETYKDLFIEHDPARMYHYARPLVSLAALSAEELLAIRAQFYRRYIFRAAFILRHLRRFWAFYLHNPDVFRRLLGIRKIL